MTQDERKVIELALDLATMHHTDAGYDEFRLKVRQLGKEALAQPEQEPVVLKLGECWPENVMQMWDYYRKEIANGNTGSEPRDWFESLAEMRLVDTTPPQRTWVGLTKDERLKLYRQFEDCLESDDWEYEKAIEAKLKEKNT